MWFWIMILGGCGCGSADEFAEMAIKLLSFFATPHDQRNLEDADTPYGNTTMEVLAHWMDSKDLIEHGTGIGGSWLTAKGNQIHECIKQLTNSPRSPHR
jgi:hypothetical protein